MEEWIARIGSEWTSTLRMSFSLRVRGQDDALAEKIAQNVIIVFELFGDPLLTSQKLLSVAHEIELRRRGYGRRHWTKPGTN
jgi:hypothetical protein